MKIEEIMSKNLITCSSNCSIYEISKLMKKENIGFIPVIDKDLIGVITDRDIVIKTVYNKDFNSPIKPYINNNIISIETDKNVYNALELMSKNKIKRLIVTKNTKLVGILSLSDILNIDIDSNKLIECIKIIYELKNNSQNKNIKIDEFYL